MRWALALLAIAAIAFFVATRSRAESQMQQSREGRAMYESLRAMALATSASDLGLDPAGADPFVYGVVMDMDVDGETATVVAFETGDTSLYLSTGGGTIGAGEHPPVAAAARRFVAAARARIDAMARTDSFPRPGRGDAAFYVLTGAGVHAASRSLDALAGGADPLSPLYAAGQDVITQLRLMPSSR